MEEEEEEEEEEDDDASRLAVNPPDRLHSDRNFAKHLCISVFNGGRIPDALKDSEILWELKNEGRLVRWLSASLQTELHRTLVDSGEKEWPEAHYLPNRPAHFGKLEFPAISGWGIQGNYF